MSEAIKMRLSPEMGATGISMNNPTGTDAASIADLLEVFRWMHEDLRRMESELRTGNIPYLPQPRHQELLSRIIAIEQRVNLPWWKKIFG